MKRTIADELKECATMVKNARDIALIVESWARCMQRQMGDICISIESLPKSKDIDVLFRRHYHKMRIRKCISDSFDAVDHAESASALLKKSMANLQTNFQTALRQAELEKFISEGLSAEPHAIPPHDKGGQE